MKKLSLLLLVFLSLNVFSQLKNEDAKSYLSNIYLKMEEKVKKSNTKLETGLHLNYSIKTSIKSDDKSIINSDTVNIYSNRFVNAMFNRHVNIFSDTVNTYTVMPEKKMILLTNSIRKLNDKKMMNLAGVKDSVIKIAEVSDFIEKSSSVIIKISIPENYQNQFQIRDIKYTIQRKTENIKQVEINYAKNSKFNWTKIDFNEINYKYSGIFLKRKPGQYIYKSKNLLKEKYQGYSVLDKR